MKTMQYKLLFIFTYLTILVSCIPLENDKLPHSQDYYAGYIKAITDNFDQLFVGERKARSADEEKVGNSFEEALKKPTTPEITAAESESDIKHYDGSASRLLTEQKRDLSNVDSNTDSDAVENNENAEKRTVKNVKTKTLKNAKNAASTSTDPSSSDAVQSKIKDSSANTSVKPKANKRAKFNEVSNAASTDENNSNKVQGINRISKQGMKKKKIQNKFEEQNDEADGRRHYILEHGNMDALPLWTSSIKNYRESYPGANYETMSQMQNSPFGFGGVRGPNNFFMNRPNSGQVGNIADDIPQGLMTQDMVPSMAGVTPSYEKRPGIFPGFPPQTLAPMASSGFESQRGAAYNGQQMMYQQQHSSPFDLSGFDRMGRNEYDNKKPSADGLPQLNRFSNPAMGQQNRLYFGANHMRTSMFLPMHQQSAFSPEDDKEEDKFVQVGQTRSQIRQVKKKRKHRRRRKSSIKRCLYNKRKPVFVERIVMPTCNQLGCKLMPVQEKCQNVYPTRQRLEQEERTPINLPQMVPIVVEEPNRVPSINPLTNVRIGNSGCNPINTNCFNNANSGCNLMSGNCLSTNVNTVGSNNINNRPLNTAGTNCLNTNPGFSTIASNCATVSNGPNLGTSNLVTSNVGGGNVRISNLGSSNINGANIGATNIASTNIASANIAGINGAGSNIGGCNGLDDINNNNNQGTNCVYGGSNQLPTKIVMVPFITGHMNDEDEDAL